MVLMDLRRNCMMLLGLPVVVALLCSDVAMANVVFKVQHKYGGRGRSTWRALKAHDVQRHQRILAAVDFPLGGNARVTDAALYYTKLAIGTPPKDYYVQVDTGSDILWVNCAGCDKCQKKSSLGLDLKLYDLKKSTSGKRVTCDEDFCNIMHNGAYAACTNGRPCEYSVTYADGSSAAGYFVKDSIKFDLVSGNLQTSSMIVNGAFSFGCSDKQTGTQGTSTDRVDGIIGFGQANSSIISQLAEMGKIKRTFSHCLEGTNSGGIFAIGEVVGQKIKSTPMVQDEPHYIVIMKKAEIDGKMLDIPAESFFDTGRKTVIDSGATLAYLPGDVYDLLMGKVFARQSNLNFHTVDPQLKCFNFSGNIDDGFPAMTLHFKNSLSLKVYPHEYFVQIDDDEWCIGWQRGGMKADDGGEMILLGDIILSNKLVVYDVQNQTIGWTAYNCSSSIKVKDEGSGNVYSVSARDISPSSAYSLSAGKLLTFLLFAAILAM